MKWDSLTSNWDDQFTPWDAITDFLATEKICASVETSELHAQIGLNRMCATLTVSALVSSVGVSGICSALEVSQVNADVGIY